MFCTFSILLKFNFFYSTCVCIFCILVCFFDKNTAGRAKKEMANTEKQEATILPNQVLGTVSPYPIVVTVIWNGGDKQVGKLVHNTHHPPPERVRIACEVRFPPWTLRVLLSQVDKIAEQCRHCEEFHTMCATNIYLIYIYLIYLIYLIYRVFFFSLVPPSKVKVWKT